MVSTTLSAKRAILTSLIGSALEDTFGHNQDYSHTEANHDETPNRQLSIPISTSENTKTKNNDSEDAVPPIRNFLVRVHQSFVDILSTVFGILELGPDLFTVVEIGVEGDTGHSGEGEAVTEGVRHGDVHGGVLLVFGKDKIETLVNDSRNVVG